MLRDIADLFRYEPGVTVGSTFGCFSLSDIRIRGLGGNCVCIQTDGIPVADAVSIGSFSSANCNFVDPDTRKRVEVVRGPTSSLYGSDVLGGVVSFITKDPFDYRAADRRAYSGLKLGADSANEGIFAGATAAFGGARWSGLVAVGRRQGRETGTMGRIGGEGSTHTQANPQSSSGRSVLGKLVFAPSDTQRFKLTIEGNEDDTATDVLTSSGFQSLARASYSRVLGDDHQSRARTAFGHDIEGLSFAFADAVDWQIDRQDSQTRQDSLEARNVSGSQIAAALQDRRERTFFFDQRAYGLQANVHNAFETGSVRHALTYGIEIIRVETRQKRDGRRSILDAGGVSNVMRPDVLPVRDIPISQTTRAAVYLQDGIVFADGTFRLVPAVRVDHDQLAPEVDAIFRDDNPTTVVADLKETPVSPKLGFVWHAGEAWSLFGGYARGFRAPPYNDVNIGFTNVQSGYNAILNPDLVSETRDGLEVGMRFSSAVASASLATYDTGYVDFIESTRFTVIDPVTGLMLYQSQNISDVRIRGSELTTGVDLGVWMSGLQGWSLRGAVAWSRGEDRASGAPLERVDPLTSSLGLAIERDRWSAELAGRVVGRRDRLPASTSAISDAETPGDGGLDLCVHGQFAPDTRVSAGIFNLVDRRYWPAGSMPLFVATSQTLTRYTAPGRNIAVSLSVDF